jgi:hypothetical protein
VRLEVVGLAERRAVGAGGHQPVVQEGVERVHVTGALRRLQAPLGVEEQLALAVGLGHGPIIPDDRPR